MLLELIFVEKALDAGVSVDDFASFAQVVDHDFVFYRRLEKAYVPVLGLNFGPPVHFDDLSQAF